MKNMNVLLLGTNERDGLLSVSFYGCFSVWVSFLCIRFVYDFYKLYEHCDLVDATVSWIPSQFSSRFRKARQHLVMAKG